jgi:hypothetical protein
MDGGGCRSLTIDSDVADDVENSRSVSRDPSEGRLSNVSCDVARTSNIM